MREETWYAVHVFSGYEQKIEKQFLQLMQINELMSKVCHSVKVPIVTYKETKDGKERQKKKKLMPGYILLDLDLPKFEEDEERHKEIVQIVKSVDGVTGFVNATTARGSKPVPLTKGEMNRIKEEIGEIKVDRPLHEYQDFHVGDEINIISGAFEGFSGIIQEDLVAHKKLKILIEIFGRPTTVQIDKKDAEKKRV